MSFLTFFGHQNAVYGNIFLEQESEQILLCILFLRRIIRFLTCFDMVNGM